MNDESAMTAAYVKACVDAYRARVAKDEARNTLCVAVASAIEDAYPDAVSKAWAWLLERTVDER